MPKRSAGGIARLRWYRVWRHAGQSRRSAWWCAARTRLSDYERLKAKSGGYCPWCGVVVTPDDLAERPIRPVR